MLKKTIIFGTGQENEKKKFNEKKFLQIIDYCLEQNLLTFDTSDNYFKGKIEKILGRRIKKSKQNIKIINKFRLINNIDILRNNLDKSLKNLNKDFIDVYMPHWPTFNIDKNLLNDFAEECIERKKIKQFGLSNFSFKMIKEFKNIYKKKFSLQFELNFSNFSFYNDLLKFCKKDNIDTYCYSIANNFPKKDAYLNQIKSKYNLNNYELSLNWLSSYNFIRPIIRSTSKENIDRNIEIFKKKEIRINEKKINIKKFYINIDLNKIKKISSGSGFVYRNVSEAKNNKYKLYPSPKDISLEIKKYGLLKPFLFKKYNKKYFNLVSGQARYWAFRLNNKRIKKIKGLLIE